MSELAQSTAEARDAEAAQTVYRSALDARPRVGTSGAVALALALHIVAFGAALILPRVFWKGPKPRRPILAHVVALGKPRDPKFLPRKEEPLAAAAPQASPSRPEAPAAPQSRPAPVRRAPSRRELMEQALAGVTADAPRSGRQARPDAEREGEATGSPLGTAAKAEAGERYFGAVHDAVLANYVVPSVISERERLYLNASVIAWIGRDGTLLRHRMEKPSGNRFFDDALELALRRTRLPAPPPELAADLARDGVELDFKP